MIDNTFQYLLIKLAEEANELSQAASKSAIFGPTDKKDENSNTTLDNICLEYNDVTSLLLLIGLITGKVSPPDQVSISNKLDKLSEWTHYSAKRGGVSEDVAKELDVCIVSYKKMEI